MKRLFIILFSGAILSLIGCGSYDIWGKWMFAPPKYVKSSCLFPSFSLSPDDRNLLFELRIIKDSINFYHDSNSIHHPFVYQLCSYDLVTDSTTILLSSDSIAFLRIHYSSDGLKILNITYRNKLYHINIYDINGKINTSVFQAPRSIFDAVLSPDNKVIYFISTIWLVDKNYTLDVHSAVPWYYEALFSINSDGSGLKRIGTSKLATISNLTIDKTGENLYFVYLSDSISGPMRLNIATNRLVSLMPQNFNKLRKKYPFYAPIPSNLNDSDYLCTPIAIYKYHEKTGNAEFFFKESQKQIDERHVMGIVVSYHNSDKLIMQKDSTPTQLKKRTLIAGKSYFIILNEKGEIERTFLPKIVKDIEAKGDSIKIK
jgi:hypothetical protein